MQKDFESFHWTRGTSSRNVMEACKRREVFLGMEEEEKGGGGSVRSFVSSYVCKNQGWRECVQESSIERVCVRIRHEKNLCSKYMLQSFWTFG